MFRRLWLWFWAGGGQSVPAAGGVYRRPPRLWSRLWARPGKQWGRVVARPAGWVRAWRWRHMANTLPAQTLVKPAGEDRDYGFDFSTSPEVVAGATVSSAEVLDAPAGLTFGSPRVNETFDGIASGEVVVVQISGGTDENTYAFAVRATLSTGRKLVVPARLVVTGDSE